MLSHLLIVLGYIFLCLSGISFAVSLGLAIFSRNRKGFLVPAIYLLMMVLLLAFVSIYPGGGSEAWTTVLFYIICISFQFVWVGPGQPGQQQDHGEFGDLRRLELDAGDVDPPLGAVDGLAEQQHGKQQRDADAVQGPGPLQPDIIGNVALSILYVLVSNVGISN